MPTPSERRALLFIAVIGVLGAGARLAAARSGPVAGAEEAIALEGQLAAVDSVAAERRRGSPRGKRTTPKAGARGQSVRVGPDAAEPVVVDVDRAAAIELDRLPRIGPALAARIVTERERGGPFGSLEELQRVSGIGPAVAQQLRPHVTFSGTPRPKDGQRIGSPNDGSAAGRATRRRVRPP